MRRKYVTLAILLVFGATLVSWVIVRGVARRQTERTTPGNVVPDQPPTDPRSVAPEATPHELATDAGSKHPKTHDSGSQRVHSAAPRNSESIGTATMTEDGTLVLDLRAEGPDGAHGDARLVYPKSHPQYASILEHIGGLRPNEKKPVPPWPQN